MTIESSQRALSTTVYEAQTRKPVEPEAEGNIPHRFKRACIIDAIEIAPPGAGFVNVAVGDRDLDPDEIRSIRGAKAEMGDFLVATVRNDGTEPTDIAIAIHVRGEHGPEAEGIPLTILNGGSSFSPADFSAGTRASAARSEDEEMAPTEPEPAPRRSKRDGGVEVRARAPEIASAPRTFVIPKPAKEAEAPLPTPPPRAVVDGDVRGVRLYRPDADALLRTLEYSAPISTALRASLDHQFAMAYDQDHGSIGAESSGPGDEALVWLAPHDLQRLHEAIQYRQEYHLEDTGILIQALQTALEITPPPEQQATSPEAAIETNEPEETEPDTMSEGEDQEDANRQVSESDEDANRKVSEDEEDVEVNEGEMLSIAAETTEVEPVPDSGDAPKTSGQITPNDGRTETDGEKA